MIALDTRITLFLFQAVPAYVTAGNIVFAAEYAPIILALGAFLYVLLHPVLYRRAYEILMNAIIAAVLARYGFTALIRALIPRERPFLALHLQPLVSEHSSSFPSAHAAILFAITGILFYYEKRFALFFGAVSIIICIARVAAGVHYPSDIIVGACVGLLSGALAYRYATRHLRTLLRRYGFTVKNG
jgi:undecaprenyl-diphosphatase